MTDEFKKTAIKAAQEAGDVIVRGFDRIQTRAIKADKTIVTNIDIEAEKKIVQTIQDKFSAHNFFTEESGHLPKDSSYTWIIDPLDGTLNFSQGIPVFCVSLALMKNNDILLSVIYDPFRKECFWAQKNKGAFLNDKQISVSNIAKLKNAFGNMGGASGVSIQDPGFKSYCKIAPRVKKIRMIGSCSLSLAYLAAGRFDFIVDYNINWWDIAPGKLMVEEAGGKLLDSSDKAFKLIQDKMSYIASNKHIFSEISDLIRKEGKTSLP